MKHTYKQELIQQIGKIFTHSSMMRIPPQCLEDMSTASLAAFKEWLQGELEANATLVATPSRVRALPAKR